MKNRPTYRLINQKGKGYDALYKRLFQILERDCIFTECFEEDSWFDGNDMIVVTTWDEQGYNLPKGIVRID